MKDNGNLLSKYKSRVMNETICRIMIARGRNSIHSLDESSRHAVALQKQCLKKLLEENKNTVYGKKYGFSTIHSIDEYKKKVPFSTYDDYEPYIRRMVKEGEKNLITVHEPKHYALSSGSVGVPKHIPVSEAELQKYNKYGANLAFGVMDEYYRNTTGHSFKSGYGVNMIELKFSETPLGVPKGAISGNVLKALQDITPFFLLPPWDIMNPKADMDLKYLRARFVLQNRDITFLDGAFMTALVDLMDYIKDNWKDICRDIYYGRISDNAEIPEPWRMKFQEMVYPDKQRARELVREFKKGTNEIIPRIWPKMQFIASIGTGGFFTYAKKMRRYTGKNIPFDNLNYAASEGLFAAARRVGDTSYVLIPDGGFYEFIPVKSEDEGRTLTIDELEEGEDYEIVITNLSGFYRYRIKDVIRVTGFYNEAPMIQFVYRKSQMLSIAGEKTNEEAVRWSIEHFIKDTGLAVNDYSVFADTDSEPGHYVFLMEPNHIVPKEDISRYRDVIEAKMMQANPSYGDKIRNGVLAPTELIFVQQQTYQLYRDLMIMKGTSANQLKPVRVIDTPMKEKFFFGLREKYD